MLVNHLESKSSLGGAKNYDLGCAPDVGSISYFTIGLG
jgi:hypothetical protein